MKQVWKVIWPQFENKNGIPQSSRFNQINQSNPILKTNRPGRPYIIIVIYLFSWFSLSGSPTARPFSRFYDVLILKRQYSRVLSEQKSAIWNFHLFKSYGQKSDNFRLIFWKSCCAEKKLYQKLKIKIRFWNYISSTECNKAITS
jgi:hypothetical protein